MRSPQNYTPWRRLRPDNARTGDLIGWLKVSCLLSPRCTNARKSIPQRLQSLPCPCVPFCRTARRALTQIVTTDDEHCPQRLLQGRSREKLRLGLKLKIKALTEVRVETKVTSVLAQQVQI